MHCALRCRLTVDGFKGLELAWHGMEGGLPLQIVKRLLMVARSYWKRVQSGHGRCKLLNALQWLRGGCAASRLWRCFVGKWRWGEIRRRDCYRQAPGTEIATEACLETCEA